jgi:hypothetical protein
MTVATAMRRLVLAAVPAALLLAGCSSSEPPPPCPSVGTPALLENFTQFEPGGGRDLTQVRFSGRLSGFQSTCEYDEKGVDLELALQMIVERGSADRERKVDVQYFVAVEDGPGNITAKQVFDVTIPFEGNSRRLARVEEISLRVPAPAGHGFKQTRILVGFQLTAEQVEYNRSRKP